MESYEYSRWLRDKITKRITKDLTNIEKSLINAVLSYKPGTEHLSDRYFYLKGKIDGVREFLNYQVEQGEENHEEDDV